MLTSSYVRFAFWFSIFLVKSRFCYICQASVYQQILFSGRSVCQFLVQTCTCWINHVPIVLWSGDQLTSSSSSFLFRGGGSLFWLTWVFSWLYGQQPITVKKVLRPRTTGLMYLWFIPQTTLYQTWNNDTSSNVLQSWLFSSHRC